MADMKFRFRHAKALALALLFGAGAVTAGVGEAAAQQPAEQTGVVIDIAGSRVDEAELAAQLAFEADTVLATARRDDNAARALAINWYEAELLAKAAADDGLFADIPGLQGAARNLGRRLVVRKYVDRMMAKEQAPDKAELESYYAMHKERCEAPLRVRIAQLGVVVPKHASDVEREAARKRLEEMRKRLAGGESFATVADEASDIPGKKPGGEMGWFTLKELGQQSGSGVIAQTKVGQLTEPIETQIGLQMYKVLEKEEPRIKTLDECRAELAAQIDGDYRKAAVRRRVDDLARRYSASMNIDAFISVVKKARGVEPSEGGPAGPTLDQGAAVNEIVVER